jgi:hypothetical protein
MPWTEPAYVATGDVMTASQWNSQVVDNLKHIADKVGRGSGVHVGTSVDPGLGHLLVAGIVSWLGQNMVVWSSPGTYSWTVPAGVYRVRSIVTGGGGGGGGSNHLDYTGAGGGAGATAFAVFNVTPGESLTITVGAGGAGGSPTVSGGSGEASTIRRGSTVLVQAAPGAGGGSRFGHNGAAYGGAGGNSATFGAGVVGFFTPGGTGVGSRDYITHITGYGGASFWGGGSPPQGYPYIGAWGGGGGGGLNSTGRNGLNGIVVIFY